MKPIIKPLILAAALSWPTIVIGAEEKCPTHEEIAALAKQVTTEYGVEDARIVILTGDKANKVAKFMHDDPAYHQGDFDILKASSFDFILFPEIIGNPGVVVYKDVKGKDCMVGLFGVKPEKLAQLIAAAEGKPIPKTNKELEENP